LVILDCCPAIYAFSSTSGQTIAYITENSHWAAVSGGVALPQAANN
jgi:hypothetical protein